MLSSGTVEQEIREPIESRHAFEKTKLFDIVNRNSERDLAGSAELAGLSLECLANLLSSPSDVGWLHPRRTRLGLIEASCYPCTRDGPGRASEAFAPWPH